MNKILINRTSAPPKPEVKSSDNLNTSDKITSLMPYHGNISDFPEANENAKEYIYEKRVTTLGSLNFRLTYDIFSTPQVYLIDKEKIIIGKKLNALSLGRMIEHLEDIKIEYLDILEKENKKEKERIENSKKKNNTE